MPGLKKTKKEKPVQPKAAPSLKTEGPIGEKDEQAIVIEKNQKLQKEAKEKWSKLKKKE